MKLKCLYPFTFLEFHPQGEVYCCCPAWTKFGAIGNIYDQSVTEIWNGKKIIKIREKIYACQYSQICKLNYCPFIKNPLDFKSLSNNDPQIKKIIKQIQEKKVCLETFPWEISLAHSGRCNLRCKMCLSHEGFQSHEEKLEKIIFKQVLPFLLPHLKYIKFSGNGDPFAQNQTVKFLENFNQKKFLQLRFKFLTNGLLLNKKMWQKIKHLQIEYINISVDAASKNVYEKIRRGGCWEKLQENLKFISQLRKNGKIGRLFINMTVMRSNVHQLEDFAKMGLKLGCDHINFSKIFGVKNIRENIFLFPHSPLIKTIKRVTKKSIFTNKKIDVKKILI